VQGLDVDVDGDEEADLDAQILEDMLEEDGDAFLDL
jgi:hypothetical protein